MILNKIYNKIDSILSSKCGSHIQHHISCEYIFLVV